MHNLAAHGLGRADAPTVLAQIEAGLIHAKAAGNAALWALEDGAKARIALRALDAHLRLVADLIDAARAEVEQAEADDTP